MRKVLKILFWTLLISLFVYSRWIYFDRDNNCTIYIIPTIQPSSLNTKSLIKLVRDTSPENYEKLCKNVKFINKSPSCGGYDRGCYKTTRPNTIFLGTDQGNPALGAAIIVQQTCNAINGLESTKINSSECYQMSSEYLEQITQY